MMFKRVLFNHQSCRSKIYKNMANKRETKKIVQYLKFNPPAPIIVPNKRGICILHYYLIIFRLQKDYSHYILKST
jgi:ribosomal protein L33